MATMLKTVQPIIFEQIRKRKVLSQNERIMGIISTPIGILICTDKRVIIYTPKSFGRWETQTFPLDHISFVNFKQRLFIGNLIIETSSEERLIPVGKKDGFIMQHIISNQIMIYKALSSGATIPNPDPLLELQLMYATGEISEEVYLRRMMTI